MRDPVRDDVDRPRSLIGVFLPRTYAPSVTLDVQFSTANIIDEPVVGFGNDLVIGGEIDDAPPSATPTPK